MGSLYPGRDPPPPATTVDEGAGTVGGSGDPDSAGAFVMSSESLIGNVVVNRESEDLGTIEHVMVDVPSGCLAYAVLASGGVFGLGEKLFAIPWSALKLDAERKCFILDLAKARLEKAPGFDKDHWPSMADTAWATGIHHYYGVRPYWTERPHVQ
jgi:hypothetical protein